MPDELQKIPLAKFWA